jgi:hypothetical protein
MARTRPEGLPGPRVPEWPGPLRSHLAAVVALSSLGAGAIHLAAADAHLGASPLLAAAFALGGVAQSGWAPLALVRRSPRLLAGGAVLNALILLGWVASRTTGLPIGPHPWEAKAVGVGDAAASVLEVVIVVGAVLLARSRREARTPPSRSGLPPALSSSFGLLAATVVAAAWRPVVALEAHHGPAPHGFFPHLVALGAMVTAVIAIVGAAFRVRPAGRQTERRTA